MVVRIHPWQLILTFKGHQMQVGDFQLLIDPGIESSSGHVQMKHGQQYLIVLRNRGFVRCDAVVKVDGQHVGTIRVDSHRIVRLSCPVHDNGCFTFYEAGTDEARDARLHNISRDNLGLVQVIFKPERRRVRSQTKGLFSTLGCTTTRSPGGTGLSGESDQNFYQASSIEYDESSKTIISLRLVSDSDRVRLIRPLSNPVPAPLD